MRKELEPLELLEPELPSPFRLVFTRRKGGVSGPPYATLNLGLRTGDKVEWVLENRRRVCQREGISLDQLVFTEQVHSSRVVKVSREMRGCGAFEYRTALPACDAMITRERDVVLCVLTADCLPIALYGGDPPAIALIHAGWKGTYEGIAGATVSLMEKEYHLDPACLSAVMGPGIRKCCYSVDLERAALFKKRYDYLIYKQKHQGYKKGCRDGGESGTGKEEVVIGREGAYYLDLVLANRMNLVAAGLSPERIVDLGICTHCHLDYFSFRREGETGRQAALFYLREEEGKKDCISC